MTKINDWTVKRLDEVATVTMGQSPASSSYNSQGAGVPFLQGTPPVVDSMGAAVPNQWTTEPTRVVEVGTALITVRAPVGELFTTNDSVCLGRGLAGIKANEDVSQTYLNYYLQFSKSQLDTFSQGSTFTAINSGDLKGIRIALPSYQEQKYIGSLLNMIDQDIAKTDRIIQKTELLKQGMMQELLTKGIGHKKFKKTKLGKIPEEWIASTIGENNLQVGSGSTPKGGSKVYLQAGIPLIRSQNVHFENLDLSDVVFISQETHDNMMRSKLKNQDVLLNITGASLGRVSIVPDYLKQGNVNQHVCIIRVTNNLIPLFLKYFLESEMGQNQIFKYQIGGNREGLNFQQVKSITIPLPSIEEQLKIIGIIKSINQKIIQEKNMRYKYISLKNGLMQDIFGQKVKIN